MKKYSDYMDEITSNELYEGLLAYGMFSEKLPPIFTSQQFYNYCSSFTENNFGNNEHDYINFDIMRNKNIPRQIGIPNPMAYQKLCSVLKDNWNKIQQHFHNYTDSDSNIISRIHIRKLKDTKSLFKMNYNNWRIDGTPEDDLIIGKKFLACADISNFFHSIYSHSLCWALVGKNQSKSNRRNGWYNNIDSMCRKLQNGETHGVMIGPHTSNLLSEIILTVIDRKLSDSGFEYIRYIDDYRCYTSSQEKAQEFLICLNNEFKAFDLSINDQKTYIEKLPIPATENWVRTLRNFDLLESYNKVTYSKVKDYIDLAIELMKFNNNNSSIINYVFKVLYKKELTDNAKKYFIKISMNLAIIYHYLLPLMDDFIFTPYNADKNIIENFANIIYEESFKSFNYEGICYAIYYSLKYNFHLKNINANKIIEWIVA